MANIINKGCYELKVGYANNGNSFTPVTQVFGQGGPSWGNGAAGTRPTVELFYTDGAIVSATVFNSTNNPDFTGNFNEAPQHAPDTVVGCDPSEMDNTVTVTASADADSVFAQLQSTAQRRGKSSVKGTAAQGFFSFRQGSGHLSGAYNSSGNTWNFAVATNPGGANIDLNTFFQNLVNL